MATRYIIAPVFYKQSMLEQLTSLLSGTVPVEEEPLTHVYAGAICDDKDTAERLLAALADEKEKWVGPVKRYEMIPLNCVYPDDLSQPLPEHLYVERASTQADKSLRLFTPERIQGISPSLIERGLVKVRKNVYYHESFLNAGSNYTAPYFNSSTSSNVDSTSSKETAGPDGTLS